MTMLNNLNINNTITYPIQPYNAPTTTAASLPAQGYYVLGQPYYAPAIFVSSAVPFAHVSVPQTTTTPTATAVSNNIQNYPAMGLNLSGPLINSNSNSNSNSSANSNSNFNTQLPPIQSMLNSNLETTTTTNTASVPLTSTSTSRLLTPNTTTKRSSAASSPATDPIVLPPLGFANTPTQTPVTTPVPVRTSISSPGSIPVQNIDQKHQLPYLSTQFRPHEINSVANSTSSNRFSSLILKDNNLGQKVMSNPVSINNSTAKQQTKKNFSFVLQSNDYHIAKNGTITKKSNIQPKSIVGRPSTVSTVDNNDNIQATSRKRRRTTKEQRQILKEAFRKNKAPSKEERLSLAQQCNMSEKAIQVWFQNQRQYMRREQNLRALQLFQIIS